MLLCFAARCGFQVGKLSSESRVEGAILLLGPLVLNQLHAVSLALILQSLAPRDQSLNHSILTFNHIEQILRHLGGLADTLLLDNP
jgi:hypothetical protein